MRNKGKKSFDKSLKLIAKSSIIVFMGIFFSKFFSYVYRVIIARSLGPEVYGLFSLAVMISLLVFAIASLGLLEGLSRYIPFYRGRKEEDKIGYLLRVSFITLIFSGILAFLFLFLFSDIISINFFHNAALSGFLKIFAIFIPILMIGSFFNIILRAYEEITWQSFINNVFQTIIQITLLGVLLFLGFVNNAVIFSYNLGILGMFVASILVCVYKIPEIFKKPNLEKKIKRKVLKQFLAYSWPMIFFGVVMSIFSWIDSFSIGYFVGVSEVGFYNVALPLASLLIFIPEIFMQLFYPLVTKEFSRKNFLLIKELSKQVGKWIFMLNLPVLVFLVFFPGAVINILFGAQYIAAEQSLRILSIGIFIFSIFKVSYNLISMAGKAKIILANIIFASICNLILNIILVPRFGINGAAIGTAVSFTILGILQMIESKHFLSIIPLRKKIIRISLVSIFPIFVLFYLRNFLAKTLFSLVLQGIVFILLYLITLLITRCFDKNDIMILRTIKKRIFG